MKVTKVEEQALRLALSLARQGGRCSLKQLAEGEQLSEPLVAKVVGKLRRGGLVRALRGRNGYYELIRPAAQLSVADVLHALNPALLQGCFNTAPPEDGICPHRSACSLRPIWNHLERSFTDVLSRLTLADLLCREGSVARQLGRPTAPPSTRPRPRRPAGATCKSSPLP